MASSASFSPMKKNTLVWKDKINKKYGFITIFCCYPTMTPNDGSYVVIGSS